MLARHICDGLRDAGFAVDLAVDGTMALDKFQTQEYDVVVLDRNLPGAHGDDVCRAISGRGPRVLILTAAGGVADRVDGLELGADDYLPKPFAFAELVARVRALCRRQPSGPPTVSRGDLVVDLARRSISRNGRTIALNRKEFSILEVLLLENGGVVSAEHLIERVWDEHLDPFSNVVAVTVGRLRRKLGVPALIETVIGVGYRL